MIAGGASGIVGMARELGADDRLVAFMQYLRVLIVVLLTPLRSPSLFPGAHGGARRRRAAAARRRRGGWVLTARAVARPARCSAARLRLPGGRAAGPMLARRRR